MSSIREIASNASHSHNREPARFLEAAFLDRWQDSSERWGTRAALGQLGDWIFKLPNNPAYSPFSAFVRSHLAPSPSSIISYGDLLGIKEENIGIRRLFSPTGTQDYAQKVRQNFRNCFRPTLAEPLTFKTFFNGTIKRYNINTITDPLIEGKIGTVGSRLFGFGFLGWSILRNSRYAYQNAKEQENGSVFSRLKTIGFTIKAFFGQAFKGIACWEAATVGSMVGRALFCIGFWPQMLGGIFIGGCFGAVAYKGLSRGIKDPIKPKKQNNFE